MKGFRNQLNFDFSGISLQHQKLSDTEKTDNKMLKKLNKHNFKFKSKIESDIDVIQLLITELQKNESINLISKQFDSPNIVLAFEKEITELYVATWAITPAGIDALIKITQNGKVNNCWLLLDRTHSYKWIFQSEAYKILRGKVKIKFCANHSKFICFRTDSGVLNFVGSMNFSKNPRFENIMIDRSEENYNFYTQFIRNVGGETL